MTREQALAWTARWREVADVVDREARYQSAAARLIALQRLRAFAGLAALRRDTDAEAAVWDRFQTLRLRLGRGGRRDA